MGEEQGLLGSKAYVNQAKKDGTIDQVSFMLNYDMTNDPKGFVTTRKEMEPLFKSWGAEVVKIDTNFKNIFQASAGLHSDHQPFMLEGITTGGGTGGKLPNNAGPYYHSDGDAFKLVDEQGLKNTVRYSAMLTYALANTPKIPVKKQNEADLEAFLNAQNLKEPLKIAGEWRWKN
jgi:Zn-dependent M28 family amino/carboxypeptidase